MRIVVTGGAGFIGSAAVRHLVREAGATVLVIDKLDTSSSVASLSPVAASPRYSFRQADVCDRARVSALLASFEPDAILHLVDTTEPDALVGVNVAGTTSLLEAAHGYWASLPEQRRARFRLLTVSSAEVYGAVGHDGSLRETAPLSPATPWAASRAAADLMALSWHKSRGLPVMVARAAAVYGPYQQPDRPLAAMVLAALRGEPTGLPFTPADVCDWLHVDDLVAAMIAMIGKGTPGEVYNVSARAERSLSAMAGRVAELVSRHSPARQFGTEVFAFADHHGVDPRRIALDSSKLERAIGWRPSLSLDQGLAATVRWYVANEAWWRRHLDARTDAEHLGLRRIA